MFDLSTCRGPSHCLVMLCYALLMRSPSRLVSCAYECPHVHSLHVIVDLSKLRDTGTTLASSMHSYGTFPKLVILWVASTYRTNSTEPWHNMVPTCAPRDPKNPQGSPGRPLAFAASTKALVPCRSHFSGLSSSGGLSQVGVCSAEGGALRCLNLGSKETMRNSEKPWENMKNPWETINKHMRNFWETINKTNLRGTWFNVIHI